MKAPCLLLAPLLLLPCAVAASQELRLIAQTRIPLGPGPQQVAVEKEGEEYWVPLFFALDEERNVHIPDFYHGRIAVYSYDGAFVRGIETPEGVTPGMNYFGRVTESGDYVTVSRQTLFLLDLNGALRWSSEVPSVPGFIHATSDALFVVLAQDAIAYALFPPQSLGSFGLTQNGTRIALVGATGGRVFAYRAEDMRRLPGHVPGTYRLGRGARFAGSDAEGNSLWREDHGSWQVWTLADPEGNRSASAVNMLPEGRPGGFWSYVSDNLEISQARYDDNAMTVATYAIR